MGYYDDLLNTIFYFRQGENTEQAIMEYFEDTEILTELNSILGKSVKDQTHKNIIASQLKDDMIISYSILHERIEKQNRRNLIFGMFFFHTSERLDNDNMEMKVYNEDDLRELIKKRGKDLEYLVNDQYPNLVDAYTMAGLAAEATRYYKDLNHFKKR